MEKHKEFSEEWMKERGFYKTVKKEHSKVDMSFAPDEEVEHKEEEFCLKGYVPCDGRKVQLSALSQALQKMNVMDIDDVEEDKAIDSNTALIDKHYVEMLCNVRDTILREQDDKAEEAFVTAASAPAQEANTPQFRKSFRELAKVNLEAYVQSLPKIDWQWGLDQAIVKGDFDSEQYLTHFVHTDFDKNSKMLQKPKPNDHHDDYARYAMHKPATIYDDYAYYMSPPTMSPPDILCDANVMNLKPGDMVVLTTPTPLPQAVLHQAMEWLKYNYPFRVTIVTLSEDQEIQTLNDEQLQQLGLQRITKTKRGN